MESLATTAPRTFATPRSTRSSAVRRVPVDGRRVPDGQLVRGDVATVRAGASGDASSVTKEDDDDDDDAFLRFLEDSMDGKTTQSAASDGLNWGGDMSGDELRNIVLKRYGRLYDARICQRRDRFNKLQIYLQIMWKFLGQKSFPLSEAEYVEQTDAVAELLSEWGVGDVVREALPKHPKVPKMDTTGANAVMIPLGLEDLEENGVPGAN
jgi:hypothetical protein|tara:strand:- start:10745 stop:11374 length:630 start_codon:yes stop_codon:yes gene_type:complete